MVLQLYAEEKVNFWGDITFKALPEWVIASEETILLSIPAEKFIEALKIIKTLLLSLKSTRARA